MTETVFPLQGNNRQYVLALINLSSQTKVRILENLYLSLWAWQFSNTWKILLIILVMTFLMWYFWCCITMKILKEIGTPDHLTCLLRNLYVIQEVTVRTSHGKTDWFRFGKGVWHGCLISPCLFNLYAEYIMQNARLDEAQAGSRFPGEISITSDIQIPPLWQKVKN